MNFTTIKNNIIIKWVTLVLIILFHLLFGGCDQMSLNTDIERILTINDISYDVNKELGYTVYISENEQYNSYLVLTSDYYGNVLLLRKHLLDEAMPYNGQTSVPSYYENSEIDRFLNNEFFHTLSNAVGDKIVESTVMITDVESIGCVGTDTLSIQRKIFLLSYTETAQEKSLVNAIEGTAIKYFSDDIDAFISTTSSGEYDSWWLRTPNTAYFNTVYGISPDGYVGVCSVGGTEGAYCNGVRPAFCLPQNTVIQQSNINGEDVYLIQ